MATAADAGSSSRESSWFRREGSPASIAASSSVFFRALQPAPTPRAMPPKRAARRAAAPPPPPPPPRRRRRHRGDDGGGGGVFGGFFTRHRNVFLYVPNLIGYARVALTIASLLTAFSRVEFSLAAYFLSFVCDELDGRFARMFDQCSEYGATLDMVTDRLRCVLHTGPHTTAFAW